MKNLQELKKFRIDREKYLDSISQDIRDVESELKVVGAPPFEYDCGSGMKLRWETMDNRLVVTSGDGALNRPLIESKFHVREALHPFLNDFLEKIICLMKRKARRKK